jgi:predicted Zn-dependent protease
MPEGRFHRMPRRLFRRGGRFLTLILLGLLPQLGGCGDVNFLSTSEEIRIGEQAQPKFIQESGGLIQDPQVQQYVDRVGQRLVQQIQPDDQRDVPWEFHAVQSERSNAFALPGGKVFITKGLLARLQNEAQLAGVLGHEIGHVVGEHIGEQMTRQMMLETGLSAVGAATQEDWIRTIGGVGGQVYMLRFSREDELESDRIGVTYMARAGYDPRAMIQVVRLLKEAGGTAPVEFLSTHPHPDTRLERLEELIGERYQEDLRDGTRFGYEAEPYRENVSRRLGASQEDASGQGDGSEEGDGGGG